MFDVVKDTDGLYKIWIDKITGRPASLPPSGKPLPTWNAIICTSEDKMKRKLAALRLTGKEYNYIDKSPKASERIASPVSDEEIEREMNKFPHPEAKPPSVVVNNVVPIEPTMTQIKASPSEQELAIKLHLVSVYIPAIMKGKGKKSSALASVKGFIDGVAFGHPELKELMVEFVSQYVKLY